MGCFPSVEDKSAKERSELIDKKILQDAKACENVIKLLLLGAGESGKSTLVKQMKIIHSNGFSQKELQSYKLTVCDNLISSMRVVINGMGKLRILLEKPNNKHHVERILNWSEPFVTGTTDLNPDMITALRELWRDGGIRRSFDKSFEYQLNDSAAYFFENMNRIMSKDYVPTFNDVLRSRVRTTGIIETQIQVDDVSYRIYDVGGQRSERRKWIQCFDDVKAVLFVAALSGYDMTLFEDVSTNRLEESLTLFKAICNNKFFISTSMILFLNKVDLFREKIMYTKRHLRIYMRNYTGPDHNVEAAGAYIQGEFTARNHNRKKMVYPHFTTATDTSMVQVVLNVVLDTIIMENLERTSLL
ncbi:guanine nucleotide-binding protein G(o) subunit alpha-like [Bolinopsis microptera]|uniref:guanine nucleotide-binding protein G(o) subunit alpha-like n=1 Tax=Bolinopsis microptera TaxID=2820187 RepID=UPI00307A065A